MGAQRLEGKALAARLRREIKETVAGWSQTCGKRPGIAALLIGEDESALGYARTQARTCRRVGIQYELAQLPETSSAEAVKSRILELNGNPDVSGIIALTPIPPHLETLHLHHFLDPAKDIDGVHPANLGQLTADEGAYFTPATPAAGMLLLDELPLDLTGKHAVVVGRSSIVGKPLALSLLHRHCTVTIAHSRTRALAELTATADILCVAVGRPHMVNGDYVKSGAVVLDFGTTYLETGVTGDCEPESVAEVAGWLTPVPGGIGPLTNALLMQNACRSFAREHVEQN